jgi:glyoxylate/hydroxypyruvate reductase A
VAWKPPVGFFDRVGDLRAVFCAGAGVDTLLAQPDLPPTLAVYRLEDAGMARQMAEFCAHEVYRLYHRRAEYEAQQREGLWRELPSPRRRDFAIGVLGLGVLGGSIATTLAASGYRVLGHARGARRLEGVEGFAGAAGLPSFLAACRVLILAAPLTPETTDLIDGRRLALLPRGAWLVNVARGALVVDEALLAALDSDHLAGATLDVFRTEPLPIGHPFWRHPKIRITPHVAAVTLVGPGARQVAEKLRALEAGDEAGGRIDRVRGY